jgi:hypothetical protein
MKLNRRVTGGLAWAGLALIIGVPGAGALFPAPSADKALVMDPKPANAAEAKPVKAVAPATKNASSAVASTDPVKDFVKAGKPLPSYITGGSTAPAAAAKPAQPAAPIAAVQPVPVPAAPPAEPAKPHEQVAAPRSILPPIIPAQPAASAPVESAVATTTPGPETTTPGFGGTTASGDQSASGQFASIDPNKPLVAPVPMPASARPKPLPVQHQQPVQTARIEPFPTAMPDNSSVVVLDPVPQPATADAPIITERELQGWKTGSLGDYLASKGLITPSQQQARPRPRVSHDFSQDGFYVTDGPSADGYNSDPYMN